MTGISAFSDLVARDHGLCVLSTVRRDGSVQSSVINAGVMPHPRTGDPIVALVAAGAPASWTICAPTRVPPSLFAPDGNGRLSKESRKSSVRMIQRPASTPNRCGYCCVVSSNPQAVPTTTGTPMTG